MAAGPAPLDDVDRRLLAVLLTDGRISVNELAGRANVSRATAYARFDRLQERGVITGFRAEVDPAAVGITITALVLVNVEQRAWENSLAELGALPGVEYVALTSGAFDFVLVVRVPDIGTLRDVLLVRLQGMRQVRSTQTVFVLDEHHQPLDLGLIP
jgi:DNA-binding Lrp family transcriptional regulator